MPMHGEMDNVFKAVGGLPEFGGKLDAFLFECHSIRFQTWRRWSHGLLWNGWRMYFAFLLFVAADAGQCVAIAFGVTVARFVFVDVAVIVCITQENECVCGGTG